MDRILRLTDKATKYVVSFTVLAAVLQTGLAPRACFDVAGAVASSGVNKLLKRIINISRPPGSVKVDPGMPSSHGNALGFLATTAALHVGGPASFTGAAFVLSGAFLTYLRVYAGHHTLDQVLVGFCLGSATAVGWAHLASPVLDRVARMGPAGEWAMKGVAVVAMAAFGAANVPKWIKFKR